MFDFGGTFFTFLSTVLVRNFSEFRGSGEFRKPHTDTFCQEKTR